MKPTSKLAVAALSLFTAAATTSVGHAAIVARYDANVATPAPAPNSPEGGGFTLSGTRTQNVTVLPGTEMDTNYWNILDDHSGAGTGSVIYTQLLTADHFSDPAGWWARARLRLPNGSGGANDTVLEVRDNTTYYGLNLVNDGTNEFIGYTNTTNNGIVSLANAELDAAYVEVAMAYDPGTDLVTAYLNGTAIGTIARADAAASGGLRRFGFGTNRAGGTSEQHWSLVEFHTGMIPEPASAGLLGVVAAAGLSARRRRA